MRINTPPSTLDITDFFSSCFSDSPTPFADHDYPRPQERRNKSKHGDFFKYRKLPRPLNCSTRTADTLPLFRYSIAISLRGVSLSSPGVPRFRSIIPSFFPQVSAPLALVVSSVDSQNFVPAFFIFQLSTHCLTPVSNLPISCVVEICSILPAP